jgi:hypothetical protein
MSPFRGLGREVRAKEGQEQDPEPEGSEPAFLGEVISPKLSNKKGGRKPSRPASLASRYLSCRGLASPVWSLIPGASPNLGSLPLPPFLTQSRYMGLGVGASGGLGVSSVGAEGRRLGTARGSAAGTGCR